MSYTRECIEKYGGIIFRNNYNEKRNKVFKCFSMEIKF